MRKEQTSTQLRKWIEKFNGTFETIAQIAGEVESMYPLSHYTERERKGVCSCGCVLFSFFFAHTLLFHLYLSAVKGNRQTTTQPQPHCFTLYVITFKRKKEKQ